MSIRESIAVDIEKTLNEFNASGILLNKVYRAPKNIAELARPAFPCAIITSADEARNDSTMGGSASTRMGTITYWIDLHVWGEGNDSDLNNLVDLVETVLETDRTRDGNALDTETIQIQILDYNSVPYSSVRMIVNTKYCYTRGNA